MSPTRDVARRGGRASTRAGRAALLAACALLISACTWRRIEPRPDVAGLGRLRATAGLAAADASTSLADLQALAEIWSSAGSFERVRFPYRDGDRVDVVVQVKLRQRVDLHRGANAGRAIAAALSLGLLTPVLGSRVSEIHEVGVRCVASGAAVGPRSFEVATDAVFGFGADADRVAKELDDAQRQRIAAAVLDVVAEQCSPAPAAARPAR